MSSVPTTGFSAFALEPSPELQSGDDLAGTITAVPTRTGTGPKDGDVVVVPSKVVSRSGTSTWPASSWTPKPSSCPPGRASSSSSWTTPPTTFWARNADR